MAGCSPAERSTRRGQVVADLRRVSCTWAGDRPGEELQSVGGRSWGHRATGVLIHDPVTPSVRRPRLGSLFSGCGGIDVAPRTPRAARASGLRNQLACRPWLRPPLARRSEPGRQSLSTIDGPACRRWTSSAVAIYAKTCLPAAKTRPCTGDALRALVIHRHRDRGAAIRARGD